MIRDFTLAELAVATGAELIGPDGSISSITTDSRQVVPGALFVALMGERFDAHQFVPQVVAAGATAILVSTLQPVDIPQLLVPDTLKALGKLGEFNRQLFSGRTVAVTGSAGKTSVKEMLSGMLGALQPTLATRGNLNNEIGAPLTLLELDTSHRYAVIELGASAVGEIAYTVALTHPDVAILNNALPAHLEGFGSLENIVRAKAEIYQGLGETGVGVVNADSPHASFWFARLAELQRRAISFSLGGSADLAAHNLRPDSTGCFAFDLQLDGESYPVQLAVMGRHMVANALAALCAWYALELPIPAGIAALQQYRGFKGRLQVHQLGAGIRLIDDSYNANPASMRAAIDALKTLRGTTILVVGDMAELGADEEALHAQIGAYAAAHGVSSLYAVGPLMAEAVDAFGIGADHFATHEDLIQALKRDVPANSAILVKGSRSAAMDRVVTALLEMEEQ